MLSVLTPKIKKSCIIIILLPLLTSTLAAGIVQIRLLEKLEKARDAKRRRLEATSTTTSTTQARNSSIS